MSLEIIYEFQDKSGDFGTTSVRIADDTTIDGVNGFAQALGAALDDLTSGVIRRVYGFIRRFPISFTSNTMGDGADVENVGKFQFLSASGQRVNVNVPALDELAVQAFGSDDLNQANTAVDNFISAMIDGVDIGGTTIAACDVGESALSVVTLAREAFRNSGKRSR